MLDVKRMRILKEVADRGSFSAAAEALSYTQSAVSQQLAALEREALRGKARLRRDVLAANEWIGTTDAGSCGTLGRNHWTGMGSEPNIAFEWDEYLAIQGLVAAGVGVAVFATLALTAVGDDIV